MCTKSAFNPGYYGQWITGAYANGNLEKGVCRYYDDDNSGITTVINKLTSQINYAVQIQPGYPRNVVNPTTTNYNVSTEEITVVNNTLGQAILPINGWYKVPANTSLAISKKIRLPVIAHYQDSELGDLGTFSSYTQKKYDKETTWNLDTDLTISRVIDPGDINEVNNVTPSISVAGLGIYQATIGR